MYNRTQNFGDAIWPNEPGWQLTRRYPVSRSWWKAIFSEEQESVRSAAALVHLEARVKTSFALLHVRHNHDGRRLRQTGPVASGSWAGKRVVGNPWNIERETCLWTLQEGNCGNTWPTVAADSRKLRLCDARAAESSLELLVGSLGLPIGLMVKNLKTDSSRPRSVYRTLSKTGRDDCGPLSDTTSTGRPWIRKMWSTTTCAVSLAEGSLGKGTKWATLEKRSTTIRITVLPFDGGRPETKSRARCDQGEREWASLLHRPTGDRLGNLIGAHTLSKPTQTALTSWAMNGHQN